MSTTRRASKRQRLARRAENDAMRTSRRDSLAVLLSRAQRGAPLSPDEAALLRAAVEAEIREGDAARTSERGQQRAMEQQRQRVEAAEAAIIEAEDERDRARAEVVQWRATYGPDAPNTYRATLDRAERAEQDRAALAAELQAVRARAENTEAGDTAALNLAQSTIRQWKARAQEAEEQAATQLNRARMWRQKAIETDDRADRFEAAWHSARDRARRHAAEEKRVRGWCAHWHDRAGRYRLAWLAARRDRKADRAAMAAELPAVEALDRVRALLDTHLGPFATYAVRRALAEPEVITDRATIRNTLAEPEPCPCPPSCTCCQPTTAEEPTR